MKNVKNSLLIMGTIALFTSCGSSVSTTETTSDSTSIAIDSTAVSKNPDVMEKNGLVLTPMSASPEFSDAQINWKTPEKDVLTAGKIAFSYDVSNYELAAQTTDAGVKGCANSDQGQHIHLILNNEPYSAHYEANFERELTDGHYVALSFLSRSYHESIKNSTAYALKQFTVGKGKHEPVDLAQPMIFYSRPKGEYKAADTKKVMLDFYLTNATLGGDQGMKVRATINGTEFMISKWQPYTIEGLPMGENKILLELLDAEGNLVGGDRNKVERVFTLTDLQ